MSIVIYQKSPDNFFISTRLNFVNYIVLYLKPYQTLKNLSVRSASKSQIYCGLIIVWKGIHFGLTTNRTGVKVHPVRSTVNLSLGRASTVSQTQIGLGLRVYPSTTQGCCTAQIKSWQ